MTKEENLFQKRMMELSRMSFHRDIVTFSDFLNLNELNILHTIPKDSLQTRYVTFGGYDLAERQLVAFLPDALCYEYSYPIQIIKIEPLAAKFAEDLTHRDYLGSLMNLGLERSCFGDLIIKDKNCYIFVKEEIADYVIEQLSRIRRTSVICSIVTDFDLNYEPSFEVIKGNVASVRLDSVIAVAFPLSRSKITTYISAAKVFVNGKLITSNGYHLKEHDIISVRGLGRIRYEGILSDSKKGRHFISVKKYI